MHLKISSETGGHFLGRNVLTWTPFGQFRDRYNLQDQGFVPPFISHKDVDQLFKFGLPNMNISKW